MRKVLLLGLGVGLWLAWGPSARAGQDESRALIEKAIKARVGKGKFPTVKAIQVKAKGKFYGDMEGTLTVDVSVQPPDKQRAVIDIEVNNMTFTVTQVINGKKGWKRFLDKTEALSEEEMKEVAQKSHVEQVVGLLELKDKSYKLSPLGEMKVKDWDTVGVQVTKKGFRDVNLYFDKKTHVLRKAEYRAIDDLSKKEVTQEKFFLEYKDVADGFKAPSKLEIHNDGKKAAELEVTETTLLETPLDASVFAKPE
jgi:hypothetical protein